MEMAHRWLTWLGYKKPPKRSKQCNLSGEHAHQPLDWMVPFFRHTQMLGKTWVLPVFWGVMIWGYEPFITNNIRYERGNWRFREARKSHRMNMKHIAPDLTIICEVLGSQPSFNKMKIAGNLHSLPCYSLHVEVPTKYPYKVGSPTYSLVFKPH